VHVTHQLTSRKSLSAAPKGTFMVAPWLFYMHEGYTQGTPWQFIRFSRLNVRYVSFLECKSSQHRGCRVHAEPRSRPTTSTIAYRENCAACVLGLVSNQPICQDTCTECGESKTTEGEGLLSAQDLRAVVNEVLFTRWKD
jgi:hypothetical protein